MIHMHAHPKHHRDAYFTAVQIPTEVSRSPMCQADRHASQTCIADMHRREGKPQRPNIHRIARSTQVQGLELPSMVVSVVPTLLVMYLRRHIAAGQWLYLSILSQCWARASVELSKHICCFGREVPGTRSPWYASCSIILQCSVASQ